MVSKDLPVIENMFRSFSNFSGSLSLRKTYFYIEGETLVGVLSSTANHSQHCKDTLKSRNRSLMDECHGLAKENKIQHTFRSADGVKVNKQKNTIFWYDIS